MSETNCITHHEACACREKAHEDEIARLTRELSEAREAIRNAPLMVDVSGVPLGKGGLEWIQLPAVSAAIEEGE